MRHSQKAKYIISTCMLAVGLFSAFILYRSFRPTAGLPYEKITPEQAMEYMDYEEGYILLDIDDAEEYSSLHIAGAINIPYSQLLDKIVTEIPDKKKMIYLYGNDEVTADKAAVKLSELGYDNITMIGVLKDWTGNLEGSSV